jgi:hypothetical protein
MLGKIPFVLGMALFLQGNMIASALPMQCWPGAPRSIVSPRNALVRIGEIREKITTNGRRSGRHSLLVQWMGSSEGIGGSFGRRNVFKILGGIVLGVPPILEIYSRLGTKDTDFSFDLFPPPASNGSWDDVEHATLVFHGSGGQDQYTDTLMKNLQRSLEKSTYSSMIEWSSYSSNILQASFNGQRVGRIAATQLLESARNLKSVHLIGISVGAFAADSASIEVKSLLKESAFVQLTLLDPFTQRGIFDFGYGAREYGKGADYFQQYLNTDDPVPSTNSPLANSVCFDITSIRPEEISFGHDWPVAYYGRQEKIGIVPPSQRLERGTLIKVEQ